MPRQPGVSATSFGPNASAPVLRGLSGDRVRVLTDGIGSLDLSSSSPDHAIAINPLTAERIEVLRGPSALAVRLVGDRRRGQRHRHAHPAPPARERRRRGRARGLRHGRQRAAGQRLGRRPARRQFRRPCRRQLDEDRRPATPAATSCRRPCASRRWPAPIRTFSALADLKGDLPNSAAESKEGAVGVAYVDGGLNVGVSVTRHLATYDVPIRYSLDPAIEAEAPTIDQRADALRRPRRNPAQRLLQPRPRCAAAIPTIIMTSSKTRATIGSSFFSKGGEGRVELVQSERSGWGGTSGVQYLDRNAKIGGEEKFLPDSEQRQAGLFTLQTLVSGPLRVEGGARVEFSKLTADADEQLGTPERSRNFTTWSGSLGGQYEFAPGWRAGLTVRAARALRRSTSCSPTARTAAASRSRSAIPTSTPKRASASRPPAPRRRARSR